MCPNCRRANVNASINNTTASDFCDGCVMTTTTTSAASSSRFTSPSSPGGARRPIEVDACDLSEAALVECHRALEEVCRRNTFILTTDPNRSPTASPAEVPVAVPEGEKVTPFHSRNPPKDLSLYALGCVMRRSTKTAAPTLWEALVLFIRYCNEEEIPPSVHLMHRLYATCIHLAIKVHDDRYFTVHHYARLAGVGEREMGALEVALVCGVDWRTLVTSDDVAALCIDPELYVAALPRIVGRDNVQAAAAEIVLPSPEVTGARSDDDGSTRSCSRAGAPLISSYHAPAPHKTGDVDQHPAWLQHQHGSPVLGASSAAALHHQMDGGWSPPTPGTPHQSPVNSPVADELASASVSVDFPRLPPPPAPILATPMPSSHHHH